MANLFSKHFDAAVKRAIAKGKSAYIEEPIEKFSATPVVADGATVIDGAGRTLMPGLIHNHVHFFMGASSQAEMLNPKLAFELLEARATKEAELMLLRGLTAACGVGGPVFGVKRRWSAAVPRRPRLISSVF